MGTWGYRLDQNDCFCEVIEAFQDMLCKGEPVPQIPPKLLMEFGGSYDDHIVRLAIAEGLWRVNSLHDDVLASILQLINSNVDNDYWSALGADSSFLSNRAAELNSFYKKISKPARQSQLWRIDSSQDSLSKGTCFWYREKGQIFGAVLLEIQKDYHLIALTEKLDSIPKTSEVILASPIYTLAWFSPIDLLSKKRMHVIQQIHIQKNYLNRFGLHTDEKTVTNTNCGQRSTWSHSFRSLLLPNCSISDVL